MPGDRAAFICARSTACTSRELPTINTWICPAARPWRTCSADKYSSRTRRSFLFTRGSTWTVNTSTAAIKKKIDASRKRTQRRDPAAGRAAAGASRNSFGAVVPETGLREPSDSIGSGAEASESGASMPTPPFNGFRGSELEIEKRADLTGREKHHGKKEAARDGDAAGLEARGKRVLLPAPLEIKVDDEKRYGEKRQHEESGEKFRPPGDGAESGEEAHRVAERGRGEKDPRQTDEMERDAAGQPHAPSRPVGFSRVDRAAEPAARAERRAVDGAPDDERPVGAMPQPAEQHRGEQIAGRLRLALAAAAARDVKIIAQPGAEAHGPAG